MRKVLKGMLVVAGLAVVAPAMAATTWTFSDRNEGSSNVYNNTLDYSAGGVTVTASAWANTGGGSNTLLETAHLGSYSGGLGVKNRDVNSGDPGEGVNPEHAADNDDRYDSILLSFSEAVNLTHVQNGWYSGDSDLTVAAFIGASVPPVLAGKSYSDLVNGGWVNIASVSNPGTSLASTNDTTTYSSYWLIGAFNPAFDSANSGWTGKKDYVKLYAAKGTICTAPGGASGGVCGGQPGTGVSEPGSLALAGLGLLGVMGLRRRQH